MMIELTEEQAVYVRNQIENDLHTFKNCIASAVEAGNRPYGSGDVGTGFDYAQTLTIRLRRAEKVYAAVNGAILRNDGTIK